MSTALKFSSLLLAVAAMLALNSFVQAQGPTNDDELTLAEVNLGTHVHGPETDADALTGKAVVIEYWGDRCPPCIRAIPHLNEVQAEHTREKLIVVANQVWTQDVDAAKKAWTNAGGGDGITVVNHGAVQGAQVRGVPHAFVFNADGTLAWRGHPASPEFDEAVAAAVATVPAQN